MDSSSAPHQALSNLRSEIIQRTPSSYYRFPKDYTIMKKVHNSQKIYIMRGLNRTNFTSVACCRRSTIFFSFSLEFSGQERSFNTTSMFYPCLWLTKQECYLFVYWSLPDQQVVELLQPFPKRR